jgi:hypothetical protein
VSLSAVTTHGLAVKGEMTMRTPAMAAVGCAALLAGTAATTTHASAGLLGHWKTRHAAPQTQAQGPLSGLTSPVKAGGLLACANILHQGGINLIGSGKQLGVGCTQTRYGAGYGVNLLTLPAIPATPFLGSCQTILQNVGTMLPFIGFPFSTGAGIRTSCGTDTSFGDPLTQLLGLGG